MYIGRHAAHLVMASRHHGYRVSSRVDVGKLLGNFAYAGQAFVDYIGAEVIKFQQDVITVLARAAAFFNFGSHRTRHHVAAGKVFHGRRITLHKTLAVLIKQKAAFAAHTLGNQHAGTRHTRRMELPELHVFQRYARARRHAQAVTSINKRVGAGSVDAPCPAGGQQRGLGVQNHHFAGFHFQRHHTQHITRLIAYQIKRHPFDEKLRACTNVTLIQRVQHGVAGAIGRRARALDGALAVVAGMAAKRALINLAVIQAVKRHAVVFQFHHRVTRLAAHKLNRILIAEVIRALDGVVHMPVPVVRLFIAQRRGNAALRGHRV